MTDTKTTLQSSSPVDVIARAHIKSLSGRELMNADTYVKLTGRYSVPLDVAIGPTTGATQRSFLGAIRVEIQSTDPDVRQTAWVALNNLAIINQTTP